jgi:hypothetical protein
MTSTLTKEQKERIEAKRQLALQRRNERQRLQNQQPSVTIVDNSSCISSNAREWHSPAHSQLCVSANTCTVKTDSFSFTPYKKQTHKKEEKKFSQFVHQRPSLSTGVKITGNCQLLSKERFSVIVPYQEQLIEIFKSIDSKVYGKLQSFHSTLFADSCSKLPCSSNTFKVIPV